MATAGSMTFNARQVLLPVLTTPTAAQRKRALSLSLFDLDLREHAAGAGNGGLSHRNSFVPGLSR